MNEKRVNEKDEAADTAVWLNHGVPGCMYSHPATPSAIEACGSCLITQRDQALAEVERLRAALDRERRDGALFLAAIAAMQGGVIEVPRSLLASATGTIERHEPLDRDVVVFRLADNTREASDG